MSTSMSHDDTLHLGNSVRTASGLNIIAGAWLFISAWVLGYSDNGTALANAVIVGAIVVILALIRFGGAHAQALPSWLNVIAGVWTFFSAWILGFSDVGNALWNNIILGVIITVLAVISAAVTARFATRS